MKFRFFLLAIFLFSLAHAEYKTIHTKELFELLKTNPSIVLVDTDTSEFDEGKRIPGALFIPYDTRDDIIAKAIPNKDSTIVIYCTSAICPNAKLFAGRLVEMGYKNIIKYADALEDWESSGYPIEKVKPGKISGLDMPVIIRKSADQVH